MRCRMIDKLRPVLIKDLKDLAAVTHRSDQCLQVKIRILLFQLQLNIICIVFIYIENNKCLGMMSGDLPT